MSELAKELAIYHRESAARLNADTSATYKSQVDAHNKTANLIEQQQRKIDELADTVERLREALQNYTAEQVCCGQGEIQYSSEGEPIGQECCGKPDIDWPEDVTVLLAATPSQNLNAVKLNALLDFRQDCGSMNGYNAVDVWDKMDEYIKREFG